MSHVHVMYICMWSVFEATCLGVYLLIACTYMRKPMKDYISGGSPLIIVELQVILCMSNLWVISLGNSVITVMIRRLNCVKLHKSM